MLGMILATVSALLADRQAQVAAQRVREDPRAPVAAQRLTSGLGGIVPGAMMGFSVGRMIHPVYGTIIGTLLGGIAGYLGGTRFFDIDLAARTREQREAQAAQAAQAAQQTGPSPRTELVHFLSNIAQNLQQVSRNTSPSAVTRAYREARESAQQAPPEMVIRVLPAEDFLLRLEQYQIESTWRGIQLAVG